MKSGKVGSSEESTDLNIKILESSGLCVSRLSAMEEGDRVNAELQRAPAVIEMRQVGVPALAGLSAYPGRNAAVLLDLQDLSPLTVP